MSINTRGFVEFLVEHIKDQGVLGSAHSNQEVEDDVVNMIWEAYNNYIDDDYDAQFEVSD